MEGYLRTSEDAVMPGAVVTLGALSLRSSCDSCCKSTVGVGFGHRGENVECAEVELTHERALMANQEYCKRRVCAFAGAVLHRIGGSRCSGLYLLRSRQTRW